MTIDEQHAQLATEATGYRNQIIAHETAIVDLEAKLQNVVYQIDRLKSRSEIGMKVKSKFGSLIRAAQESLKLNPND